MSEVLMRLLWISAIAVAIAYVTYLFFAGAAGTNADENNGDVIAVDTVQPGLHHLSGIIMVPSACYGLAVKVKQTTPLSYHLLFETWEEPYRDCPEQPFPRKFHAVTFAPSIGVQFSASLDGEPFPLHVVEVYRK